MIARAGALLLLVLHGPVPLRALPAQSEVTTQDNEVTDPATRRAAWEAVLRFYRIRHGPAASARLFLGAPSSDARFPALDTAWTHGWRQHGLIAGACDQPNDTECAVASRGTVIRLGAPRWAGEDHVVVPVVQRYARDACRGAAFDGTLRLRRTADGWAVLGLPDGGWTDLTCRPDSSTAPSAPRP